MIPDMSDSMSRSKVKHAKKSQRSLYCLCIDKRRRNATYLHAGTECPKNIVFAYPFSKGYQLLCVSPSLKVILICRKLEPDLNENHARFQIIDSERGLNIR